MSITKILSMTSTMGTIKVVSCCLFFILGTAEAFTTPSQTRYCARRLHTVSAEYRTKPLDLFGRNKESIDKADDLRENVDDGERKRMIPFFGRPTRQKSEGASQTAAVAEKEAVVSSTALKQPDSAADRAKLLRAQAERIRLEADRMDAELTLSKIEKLESQLKSSKTKGESIDDLQQQLDNLQAKLRGEPPKPAVPKPSSIPATAKTSSPLADVEMAQSNDRKSSPTMIAGESVSINFNEFVDDKSLNETIAMLDGSPGFMKRLFAKMVEIDFDTTDDINMTQVATRFQMMNNGDFSFYTKPSPSFTEAQLSDAMQRLDTFEASVPESFAVKVNGDKRKMAQYVLEMEYFMEQRLGNQEAVIDVLSGIVGDEELIRGFIDGLNVSALDRFIKSTYPECMRKEDSQEPTLAQVQAFASNVLPKAKFSATSKPEKVLGGYLVTGTYKYTTGDELIDAIDKELEQAGLADKMQVLLADDFTSIAKASDEGYLDLDIFGEGDLPPLLYITGPDVVRDAKPVLLSLVSGLGIASSWYLSIYPFLLNPALSQRIEEQLAIADAGMTYDLEWLTDLSIPLFFSFMGIQLIHELGHRVAAALNDVKLSPPTLVPSIVTGITSSVTSFKSLPKNRDAMLEIAVTGPLLGTISSIAALTFGAELTLASDSSMLPSLPVDILRQSMLGGGIIDRIIQGALYVPEGAPSEGLMVSLHPLAVAGFISLIVNALAMLPVGTTDGGRVAQAIFGRSDKVVVAWLTMAVLLFSGLFGSDLFLFYFAFVIACQQGNEVPARNEFDEVSIPRVAIGALAFALAFLTLIPIQ